MDYAVYHATSLRQERHIRLAGRELGGSENAAEAAQGKQGSWEGYRDYQQKEEGKSKKGIIIRFVSAVH